MFSYVRYLSYCSPIFFSLNCQKIVTRNIYPRIFLANFSITFLSQLYLRHFKLLNWLRVIRKPTSTLKILACPWKHRLFFFQLTAYINSEDLDFANAKIANQILIEVLPPKKLLKQSHSRWFNTKRKKSSNNIFPSNYKRGKVGNQALILDVYMDIIFPKHHGNLF